MRWLASPDLTANGAVAPLDPSRPCGPRRSGRDERSLPGPALGKHTGRNRTSADASAAPSPTTTVPSIPMTTTTTTTTLPPPGPGFLAGHVTAVGDSVMLDYQSPLQTDIPGIEVDAARRRQWSDGVQILEELKASVAAGGGGDRGPGQQRSGYRQRLRRHDADPERRLRRVVFVNTHVDRPWQDPNNAVLANGAMRYPNVVVADWATIAAQNPNWFGSDGTHLPIDGAGAMALALLITSTLATG